MITIQLQPSDLENLRFAYSPLLELSMSFRLYIDSQHESLHWRWLDEAQRALQDLEFPYLRALILPRYYLADFMTPTPTGKRTTLEDDIERLRATPLDTIRASVHRVMEIDGESPVRRQFLAYPHEAMEALIEEIRLYWQRVMAHHWNRIAAVLDNDVLYRAREMALHGVDTMFGGLNPIVRYRQGIIELHKKNTIHDNLHYELPGVGVQLVPVIFGCSSVSWQIVPEYGPMIIYNARGTGLWHQDKLPDPEKALEVTLGAGRARLLIALRDPAHTSELAMRLQVTAGAVSQHLNRLNEAGLVEAHRQSNRVYYRLSERGEKLLTLFAG